MFKIDGKQNIYISRGDSAQCEVTITSPEFPYDEYTMQNGDVLIFTVRPQPTQLGETEAPLIQKTLTNPVITIDPEDTASLEYGQYFYDVKLILISGAVHTIVPYVTGKHYNLIADLPSFYVCEVVH